MAAATLDLSGVDWTQPASFYCEEGMCGLADAAVQLEGNTLPIHTQVLAMHSKVLRELFLSQREVPGGSSGNGDRKRKAAAVEGEEPSLVLSAPFDGFSLQEVACFLRLLYHPAEATPANLAAMQPHAAGVIRLAHMLNVQGTLLPAAEQYLAGQVVEPQAALEWLQLAEACEMRGVWCQAIRSLALHMASGDGSAANAFATAQQIGSLSPAACQAVLGAMGAAYSQLGSTATAMLAVALPSAEQLAHWPDCPAQEPAFLWHVMGVVHPEGLQLHRGFPMLTSPVFRALGRTWRLLLRLAEDRPSYKLKATLQSDFAFDRSDAAQGQPSIRAGFAVEFVDQTTGEAAGKRGVHTFHVGAPAGYTIPQLTTLTGLSKVLVDGAALLRVRMWQPTGAADEDQQLLQGSSDDDESNSEDDEGSSEDDEGSSEEESSDDE